MSQENLFDMTSISMPINIVLLYTQTDICPHLLSMYICSYMYVCLLISICTYKHIN